MWAKWQVDANIECMSLQTSIWEFSEEYLLTEGEASETEEILGKLMVLECLTICQALF